MKICPRCSELYPDDVEACPLHPTAVLETVLDPMLGRTLGGRFRLLQRLGSGGMSSVYLARHVSINRTMAIKLLRPELARDPIQRDRFLREARAVNRINHENIVEITDFGETEDALVYLVMEYVPGEPLYEIMGDGPVPAPRALDIVGQCGSALARAHQMGIVHRDLKPENILLVHRPWRPDFVKILDFGIAKILDAPSLTGSQQIFGTPGYIAPEYIQSTNIDGRADLYSLGCILYELVTGALPFDYEYPGDLLVKHAVEAPIPPRARLASIPSRLNAFILQCLEKDPDQRFRDAHHFAEELRKVWETLPPPSPEAAPGLIAPQTRRWMPALTPMGVTPMFVARDAQSQRPTALGVPTEPAPSPASTGVSAVPNPFSADLFSSLERKRERIESLKRRGGHAEAGREGAEAVEKAVLTFERLEAAVREAEARQSDMESLYRRARDFRKTLGRAVDQLAARLSAARGAFDEALAKRNRVRSERDHLRGGVPADSAPPGEQPGPADALLWQLAASDEQLRLRAEERDAIEVDLGELTLELDRLNEAFDVDQEQIRADLDGALSAIDRADDAFVEALTRAEAVVAGS